MDVAMVAMVTMMAASSVGAPEAGSTRLPAFHRVGHSRALPERLSSPPHGGRRGIAGTSILAALLVLCGGLVAHAAEPSAPDRLPSQVQGVVGSGDQLSLRLKEGDNERTLAVGDLYQDGWTLAAVTASSATLTKDGVSRQVGLNPGGALAPAASAAPATTVSVLDSNPAVLAALANWNGRPRTGLSVEETRRQIMLTARVQQIMQDDPARRSVDVHLQAALLGADGPEFVALFEKASAASRAQIPVLSQADASGRYLISYPNAAGAPVAVSLAVGESQVVGSGDQAETVTLSAAAGSGGRAPTVPGALVVRVSGAGRTISASLVPGAPRPGGN